MSVIHGDCLDVMAAMPEASVDAIVCDPPYDLTSDFNWGSLKTSWGDKPRKSKGGGFMGKEWDGTGVAFRVETWQAALRVAKPGAYLLAFGGTRTVHRMTVALEDAGWIIRDMLVWGYACLSDDTEILTDEGWVQYNSASEGQHAAAFDPATGAVRWERIEAVHRYDHEGPMALVGPQLVTLNHRVVIDEDAAAVPRLPGVWRDVHAAGGVAPQGSPASVLAGVQREAAPAGPAVPHRDTSGLAGGVATLSGREDVWPGQSRLEGRRYRVQEAWELLGGSVRARAILGIPDGTVGRLRHGAPAGDGRDVRVPADQDRGRQPREPRPDRQPAGEPDALAGQPDAQAGRVRQVPGGDSEPDPVRLVDGYSGVVWCITVPSGAFVARRNGVVFVTGNSGFPKSRALLKPAWEPIVMARKPGPLRELDIDGCRIGYDLDQPDPATNPKYRAENGYRDEHGGVSTFTTAGTVTRETNTSGRWPANVVLTDPIFDGGIEGVVGGGWQSGGGNPARRSPEASASQRAAYGGGWTGTTNGAEPFDTDGTYSRFFLIPKASRSDREPVLPGMLEERDGMVVESAHETMCAKCGRQRVNVPGSACSCPDPEWVRKPQRKRANHHPTVKPIELMRHLVRLVTPTDGVVLDPFGGSGTTALAAEQEGRDWVLIEREAEYVAIAEARLAGWQRGLGLEASA